MSLRQDCVVVAIVVGVLLGLVGFASLKMGRSQDKAMAVAVEQSLQRIYDRTMSGGAPVSGENRLWVSSDQLMNIILDADKHTAHNLHFPSFVRLSDFFLPVPGVTVPSTDMVCVVRITSGKYYGVDGHRVCRQISFKEFENWHHQPLLSDAATTKSAGPDR
jgi:hypothetical protein